MQTDITVHRPEPQHNGHANVGPSLLLLFHGVGSSAEDLAALGQVLAMHRPNDWVVSVRSPHASDLGQGWQWFSVRGVTESNRPERVSAAMPSFIQRVGDWQSRTGVDPQRTTLIGFSQGAIMALESTQIAGWPAVARRVVAIAGRFAQPPRLAPADTTIHLLHGEQDTVMPIHFAIEAHQQLQALGIASSLDRFTGLGHGIDSRLVQAMVNRINGG